MTKRAALFLAIILLSAGALQSLAAQGRRVPSVDDLLLVKSAGGARISPDGAWVAYTVTETDFKQDAFVTQVWLADVATGKTFQLTRGEKTSSNIDWSPDGRWLSFTSARAGDKNQLFIINPSGGEAQQLTKSETAVGGYEWSPDGKTIAYSTTDAAPKAMKDRKEYLGDYEVVRKEYNHSHIWTIDVAEAMKEPQAGKQRTKGKDFTVNGFSWSPDSKRIAFSAQINPDLIQGAT
ncbi:MAG TPA: DPP IV N-terminal domain-containing protein, partial [Blastocatellia bacterium]